MSGNCGNPLLRDWMKEWMEEAQQMRTKAYYTYKKAYDSLCRCPVSFSHPKEAIELAGIGDNLAKRLEDKMIQYCQDNGLPVPTRTKRGNKRARRALEELEEGDENEGATRIKRKKRRMYVPTQRSGGYAILLCLLDFYDKGIENISQNQICREGQQYTDTSLTRREAGSNYNGFSSMKTLINHGYVWKNGSPAKYCLTETGIKMAEYTRDVENGVTGARDPRLNDNNDDNNDNGVNDQDDMDDDLFGLDLSLYVLDPSKHTSISINGRTRTVQPSGSTPSSQNAESSSSSNNNNNSNNSSNSSNNNSRNSRIGSSSNNRNNTYNGNSWSSTQSLGDPMDDIFGSSIDDELSKYVLNPSKHSSISVNGKATLYRQPESSNPINVTTTPFSNNRNGSRNDNGLSSGLPFDLTDEELAYNLNQTSRARSGSADSDIIEILSPPPSSSIVLDDINEPPTSSSQRRPSKTSLQDPFDEDDSDFFPQSQARSQTIKEDTFHFTYIDPDGNPVRHFSQAAVSINSSEKCVMYRLRFYTSQRQHNKAPPIKDVEVDHENREYAFAYISEGDITAAICPGLPAKPVLELHGNGDNESNDFWPPDSSQSRIDVIRKKKRSSQTITSSQTSISSSQIDSSQHIFSQSMIPTSSQIVSSSQTSSISGSQPVSVSQIISESETTTSYSPGEYEILLVLDSREIQMQKDRQYFQRLLKIKGINVITRSLDLGDVIWVARKKGHESPADELYLDFVVERKRLDDLVSSIKDGRFNEQKGRLKRSGSRKVIYIIEEYDREGANQFGAQAIQTAMSSTQVIDGFYLKHTNNPEETIDYLVMLTKSIEEIYKNTTLHSIPEHIITRQNYRELKKAYQEKAAESDKAYLVTYPLYSDLNKKAGSTTLHDIFMRMLMTIRGINAERALALMKIYPTPAALLQAFAGKTPEQGKSLAKDATKDQIARRKWVNSTSERLYEIWGTEVYPEDEDDSDGLDS